MGSCCRTKKKIGLNLELDDILPLDIAPKIKAKLIAKMTGQSVKEVYQQFWIKSPMIIYGKQIVLYVLDNHQN